MINDKKSSFEEGIDSMIQWDNWNLDLKENEIDFSNKMINSIRGKVQSERNKVIKTLSDALEQEKGKGNTSQGNYDFSVNQAKKVVDA